MVFTGYVRLDLEYRYIEMKPSVTPDNIRPTVDGGNRLRADELNALRSDFAALLRATAQVAEPSDGAALRPLLASGERAGAFRRDRFGNSQLTRAIRSAVALCENVSPDRNMVVAQLLYPLCQSEYITPEGVENVWGADIAKWCVVCLRFPHFTVAVRLPTVRISAACCWFLPRISA